MSLAQVHLSTYICLCVLIHTVYILMAVLIATVIDIVRLAKMACQSENDQPRELFEAVVAKAGSSSFLAPTSCRFWGSPAALRS